MREKSKIFTIDEIQDLMNKFISNNKIFDHLNVHLKYENKDLPTDVNILLQKVRTRITTFAQQHTIYKDSLEVCLYEVFNKETLDSLNMDHLDLIKFRNTIIEKIIVNKGSVKDSIKESN